jgi:hypothetical protein
MKLDVKNYRTPIEILSNLVSKVLGIFLGLDKNVPKTNLGL